jgi:hypothetical protein
MSRVPFLVAACAVSAVFGPTAASQPGRRAAPALPGRIVDVRAGDYYFQAPDSVPAGLVTLRLTQHGKEGHMLWLVRLPAGRSAGEFQRLAARHEPRPWAAELGGPGYAGPTKSSNATYVLEPGQYVLVCYVGSGRGVDSLYHVWRGMVKPLRVTPPSKGARSGGPDRGLMPDAVARIDTNGIVWSAPLRAGRRVIRVENRTTEWREFLLERVLPGRTVTEALAWRRRSGTPAPVEALGGLASLPPGASLATTLDVPAGTVLLKTRVSRDSGLVALEVRGRSARR